jgi:hypothetical protein
MSDAMNAEKMLEYVLCESADANREPDERPLHLDPVQTTRLECLRLSVHRLVDDGLELEPPSELARRTVAFVARNRRRPMTLLDQVATRLPFRWADFAVAAGIVHASG